MKFRIEKLEPKSKKSTTEAADPNLENARKLKDEPIVQAASTDMELPKRVALKIDIRDPNRAKERRDILEASWMKFKALVLDPRRAKERRESEDPNSEASITDNVNTDPTLNCP
jgi:hypothetical protein